MALIIHKEAQERLRTLMQKMDEMLPKSSQGLLALIMSKALLHGCIDSGCACCEGVPADFDFMLYPMSYSNTDFEWVLWDKAQNKRDMNGGICCHTRWFKDVMDGKSAHNAYKESGATDYLIEWGSHT